jgi:hypothetical protein
MMGFNAHDEGIALLAGQLDAAAGVVQPVG